MKTIDRDIHMRITYTMTYQEAKLIERITESYVALARHLTQDVSVRFPEKKEVLEAQFQSLTEGIHEAIHRCDQAQLVWDGRLVAVDAERLERLEAAAKELREVRQAIQEQIEKKRKAARKDGKDGEHNA